MSKYDLTSSTITFTTREVERLRNFGYVTRSGVVYHGELAGPNGMSFLLMQEDGTS